MIEDLKQVRDLAERILKHHDRHSITAETIMVIIDRIIAYHTPDASKMVVPKSKEECERIAEISIRYHEDGTYGYTHSGCLSYEHIFACLNHHSGKMVAPDGYKLVDTKNPITSEMKAACIGEFSFTTEEPLINEDWEYTGEKYDRENVVPWDLCKKIYKTMLSAAPQPPAKGGE